MFRILECLSLEESQRQQNPYSYFPDGEHEGQNCRVEVGGREKVSVNKRQSQDGPHPSLPSSVSANTGRWAQCSFHAPPGGTIHEDRQSSPEAGPSVCFLIESID